MARIWHGLHARLHQGTIIVLSDLHEHDECCGESAAIERFDGARGQWLVRLRSGALAGRERFVPEASMQLSHCRLAPEAKLRSRLGAVPAQGAGCGRGLVAAEPCAPGQTLFEEAPFLLAPHNATHMWSARWRLHLETALAARAGDAGARAAAAAFGELSPGPARDDARRRALRAAAGAVVDEALAAAVDADAAAADAAARDEAFEGVLAVLVRWQSNQFSYKYGTGDTAALFNLASRLNHACAPSVVLEPRWQSAQAPGACARGDGLVVARAARALRPGEPLCINYGPAELVDWPVEKRRAYLLEKHRFVCGCARCVEEGARTEPTRDPRAAAVQ